jgi:hypothetical protein
MASNVVEHSGGNGHGSGGGNGQGIGGATASTRSSGGNGRGSLYGVQIDGGQDIGMLRGTSGPIPAADPARTHRFSLAQVCMLTYRSCVNTAALRMRYRRDSTLRLTVHDTTSMWHPACSTHNSC